MGQHLTEMVGCCTQFLRPPLILSAGRSSDKVKRYHLDVIHGLLKEIKLSSVLDDLPSDEAAELRDDLRVLGLY
ncbi:Imm2 family immunity protein [Pseudomonas aeruginosa]|uniref:Imm2 family immunity protein n=1 Tax=Pseudomonas aeruginosa TaxID=287 RepID=UPI003A7F5CD7